MSANSFGAQGSLEVGDNSYTIQRLSALAGAHDIERLPYSLKVLLENLLRHEDGVDVLARDVEALADFATNGASEKEIAFSPGRILLQDLTGVPAVVDLAALRDAVEELGGRSSRVNPLIPVDLVIDHSVVVDTWARPDALARNTEIELERNAERYRALRWAQQAFSNFRVVPPGAGICHQVNLELLSQVVLNDESGSAFPDTLVGTDSHTTMVNGLGVIGWGVGGIEAEAAMLGQSIPLLIPEVVGLHLSGELPEGTTATDLVLTIAELLRSQKVVGKFVECYGPGLASIPVENRATIGNMSPEYGSTVTIFPIDDETMRYLRFTGRSPERLALVEAYAKEQGLWHDPSIDLAFSSKVSLDLSSVVPSIAGPSRPHDRVPLNRSKPMFRQVLTAALAGTGEAASVNEARPHDHAPVTLDDGTSFELDHGHVVIAAITSCTNTSNPQVMIAAGLVAKRAVELGLSTKAWVKTSLAPGSRVVMDYYERAGLTPYLEKLGFGLVGFGCTTCIGNSGPLRPEISAAITSHALSCVAVVSGNRNFDGRIHPDVRMNYLASPPLVVAYAIAGSMDIDLYNEPLGSGADGTPVFLRDIWPTTAEVARAATEAVRPEMYHDDYADVFTGNEAWRAMDVASGNRYEWDDQSTYVRKPPYFDGMGPEPEPVTDIIGARALAMFGDSITTDHISPAGSIKPSSPAGRWLSEQGVEVNDYNSYGTRRGNHEVLIRGTFANTRIRNRLAPGTEGGVSVHLPDGAPGSIYDVAMTYAAERTPLIIFAGKEYGSGSSRDWAAKGTALLGVRAVIAESYERIHRSNLIGMGVAPLEFLPGQSAESLGLSGSEVFTIAGLAGVPSAELIGRRITVQAGDKSFTTILRIDAPTEAEFYVHGGILRYVVRRLASE